MMQPFENPDCKWPDDWCSCEPYLYMQGRRDAELGSLEPLRNDPEYLRGFRSVLTPLSSDMTPES